MHTTAKLLLAALIAFPPFMIAVDYGKEGAALGKSLGGYFSSNSKQKVITPINTSTSGTTVDGSKTFSGQISCGGAGAKSFLDLSFSTIAGGDISINAQVDRDLNGAKEYSYSTTYPASGICSNGIVSCDAGTWNNCKYYKWGYNNTITLSAVTRQDMGGCYCINNSCGGLAAKSPDSILQSAGNGLTALMMQYSKNFMITKTNVTSTVASYWGQNAGNCVAADGTTATLPSVDPTTTYSLAGVEEAKISQSANPNSAYSVFTAGANSVDLGVTSNTCTIKNVMNINTTVDNKYVLHRPASPAPAGWGSNILSWYNVTVGTFTDKFFIKTAGNYTIQSMIDNRGWVKLDGTQILTLGNWPTLYSKTMYLTAGEHTITTYGQNDDGPYGTSAAIYDSSNVKIWDIRNGQDPIYSNNLSAGVQNSCQEYIDKGCKIKEEQVCDKDDSGCVTTMKNYVNTGIVSPEYCYTASSGSVAYLICADSSTLNYTGSDGSTQSFSTSPGGFTTKRTYECTVKNDTDFEDIKKSRLSINATESADNKGFSYSGSLKNEDGSWSGAGDSGTINFDAPPQVQYCQVKFSDTTKEVVYSDGTNKATATTSTATVTSEIRECTGDTYNVCPLKAGESIKQSCGSINDMAEVVGTMEAANQAAKDMICSND